MERAESVDDEHAGNDSARRTVQNAICSPFKKSLGFFLAGHLLSRVTSLSISFPHL